MSLLLALHHPDELPLPVRNELEQLIAALQMQVGAFGQKVDIPYHARYFSVDSGTVTVTESGLNVFSYTILGGYLLVVFDIQSITVTGTPNIISLTAPEGFRVKVGDRLLAAYNRLYTQPVVIQTGVGTRVAGEVWVTNNAPITSVGNTGPQVTLHFHQLSDANFAAGAGASIGLFGHCLFEYEKVQ